MHLLDVNIWIVWPATAERFKSLNYVYTTLGVMRRPAVAGQTIHEKVKCIYDFLSYELYSLPKQAKQFMSLGSVYTFLATYELSGLSAEACIYEIWAFQLLAGHATHKSRLCIYKDQVMNLLACQLRCIYKTATHESYGLPTQAIQFRSTLRVYTTYETFGSGRPYDSWVGKVYIQDLKRLGMAGLMIHFSKNCIYNFQRYE